MSIVLVFSIFDTRLLNALWILLVRCCIHQLSANAKASDVTRPFEISVGLTSTA